MPLYEYECTSCHRRTEKIQKFSDAGLTVCPHCGGPLERTITAAAVSFKGGGWFKDGYASAKPPATGGDSSAATASADSNSTASSSTASGSGAKATSSDTPKPAASPSSSPAPASTPAATTKA